MSETGYIIYIRLARVEAGGGEEDIIAEIAYAPSREWPLARGEFVALCAQAGAGEDAATQTAFKEAVPEREE